MSKASKFKEVLSIQSITELKVTKAENTKDIKIKGTAVWAVHECCKPKPDQIWRSTNYTMEEALHCSVLVTLASFFWGNEMINDSVFKLDHKKGSIALRNFILTK